MNDCARIEEVEELALGNIEDDEARRAVRAHLEVCASCREALAMFEEERELFARRAEVLDGATALEHALAAAPFLAPAAPLSFEATPVHRPRGTFGAWYAVGGASRAVVAVAACAATIAGVVRVESRGAWSDLRETAGEISADERGSAADARDEPPRAAPSGGPRSIASPPSSTSPDPWRGPRPLARAADARDDTFVCAVPALLVADGVGHDTVMSDEELTCTSSQVTCGTHDEARDDVTSSSAAP